MGLFTAKDLTTLQKWKQIHATGPIPYSEYFNLTMKAGTMEELHERYPLRVQRSPFQEAWTTDLPTVLEWALDPGGLLEHKLAAYHEEVTIKTIDLILLESETLYKRSVDMCFPKLLLLAELTTLYVGNDAAKEWKERTFTVKEQTMWEAIVVARVRMLEAFMQGADEPTMWIFFASLLMGSYSLFIGTYTAPSHNRSLSTALIRCAMKTYLDRFSLPVPSKDALCDYIHQFDISSTLGHTKNLFTFEYMFYFYNLERSVDFEKFWNEQIQAVRPQVVMQHVTEEAIAYKPIATMIGAYVIDTIEAPKEQKKRRAPEEEEPNAKRSKT